MMVTCDHCTRTAGGSRDDLIDAGWCKIIVTAPFRRTFVGCLDHARLASNAAGGRRTLAGVVVP